MGAASRCNLHATSRSPPSRRAIPCRFFLCHVALLCLVLRRRRRLPVPCSHCFLRLSAQLRPPCCISWPLESIELSSSKDESSDAHCDHLPPSHIIAEVHFGCIVIADNGISTGSSSSESSSLSSFRSALRSVRSMWLTLHAVNRRFIHPIFFSRSSARALVLSLFRTHVCMAIEAAFPTTCSSLVT